LNIACTNAPIFNQANTRIDNVKRIERAADFDTILKPNDYHKSSEREKIEFPVWDDAKGEYVEQQMDSK
ncbi:hypothetical protein DOY81_015205, partial [Sarcophaga bullata]